MNTFEISISIVLTGIILVFAVLSILTLATIGSSKLIKFLKRNILIIPKKDNFSKNNSRINSHTITSSNSTPNDEIIAVIAATVYSSLTPTAGHKYKIKNIKPIIDPEGSHSPVSVWRLAGVLENINLFKL